MTHPDPVQHTIQPPHSDTHQRLREAWPDAQRLIVAFRLAKDIDTCHALLNGQAVDPQRIHQDELRRALKPRLVQLVRPIDLLEKTAA